MLNSGVLALLGVLLLRLEVTIGLLTALGAGAAGLALPRRRLEPPALLYSMLSLPYLVATPESIRSERVESVFSIKKGMGVGVERGIIAIG